MAIRKNKAEVGGNLTADPELKTTQGGTKICNFDLAVNYKTKDKEDVEFIKCVAFGQPAEYLSTYAKRGYNVLAEGRISTRSYDKDGQKHYITEVIVTELQIASSFKNAASDKSNEPEDRNPGNGSRTNQKFRSDRSSAPRYDR